MQRDAFTLPPSVGDGPEEFKGAADFPQQHAPNRGGELRSDPSVRHVADVIRRLRRAPDDLGPMPPAAGPPARERDRQQPEGVLETAQRHEGVEVTQHVGGVDPSKSGAQISFMRAAERS